MIVIIDLDRQLLSGDGWWFIIRMIVLIFARLTIEINSTITTSFYLSLTKKIIYIFETIYPLFDPNCYSIFIKFRGFSANIIIYETSVNDETSDDRSWLNNW